MNISKNEWMIEDYFDLTSPVIGVKADVTPLALMSGELSEELLELNDYSLPLDLWDRILLNPTRMFLSTPGKSLRRDFVQLGWRLAWMIKRERASTDESEEIPPCPDALIALIEILHNGSLIIDDIEDESETRRGQPCLHRKIGVAAALNIGNWLYFVAASMVDRLDCDERVRGTLHRTLTRVMLRCHQGQALDLSCRVTEVNREQIKEFTEVSTRLKSGVLVGFAMQLGSIYHDLTTEDNATLYRFGEQIGLSLQMYDDLSGIKNPKRWYKGLEDLSRARLTWVWSWLADNSEVSAQDFRVMMQRLKEISESGFNPQSDEPQCLNVRREAQKLRDMCLIWLNAAPQHISENIDLAIDRLAEYLDHPRLITYAHHAVVKLKSSYL